MRRTALIGITTFLVCLVFALSACNKKQVEDNNYKQDEIVSAVTDADGFSETETDKTKNTYESAVIERIFARGDQTIYYVTAKGYNASQRMNLVILLEATTVKAITALDLAETDNYGTRVFRQEYLQQQYYGLDLKRDAPLALGARPGKSVDVIAVSGATKTSQGLIEAVNAIVSYLM